MFYTEIHGISSTLVTVNRDMYQAQLAVTKVRAGVQTDKSASDYTENVGQMQDAITRLEELFAMDSYLYNTYTSEGQTCSTLLDGFRSAAGTWIAISESVFAGGKSATNWEEQENAFFAAKSYLNDMEDVLEAYADYQSAAILKGVQTKSAISLIVIIGFLLCSLFFNIFVIHYIRISLETVTKTIGYMFN